MRQRPPELRAVAASKTLTPEQRTQRARLAALTRWSGTERGPVTRQHLFTRFIREAHEADPGITDAEAAHRAELALKAHMTRMAFNSSKARGARKAAEATNGAA
jgi:hypothetical protein